MARSSPTLSSGLLAWPARGQNYSIANNAWLKLTRLPWLLGSYQRIIMCDADILPHFANLRREDCEPLLSGPPALAQDHGIVLTDDRFTSWCQRKLPESGAISKGELYYNSGLMALTPEFAWRLWELHDALRPIPVETYHDQDFVNYVIARDRTPIQRLPFSMNWMAPQMREETLATARLIHFAGADKKPLIADYAALLPPGPEL